MTDALQSVLDQFNARLQAVEAKVGVAPAVSAPASPSAGGGGAPQVAAFDAYCAAYLDPFVAACDALGAPEASACGAVVKDGWAAMRGFIVAASECKKPANFPGDCMGLIKPCQEVMQAASRNVGRGDWECHQKTVSEGVQCLSWLITAPGPKDVVESYVGGQDFWANKIRVKYKKSEPKQIAFCDTFKKLMLELMPYIKAHHLAGLAFNPRGGDVKGYAGAPAPAPAPKPAAAVTAKPGAALGAALAGLQNATDLQSKGLRKVGKDEQTWRKEFKGGEKPAPKRAFPKAAPKKQTVTKGDPKTSLDKVRKKWMVENQQKAQGVVTVDIDPNEGQKYSVYIACCYEATIVVNGKCNSIVVDGCQKCQVVFDSCIASFEVVNSKSLKVQCKGTVPSIAIDKTDGILTYLSAETLAVTSFLTSKSSDMQVSFPDEAGDMVEAPIPEQFQHKACLVNGKPSLTTDVSDLYSH